MKERIDAIIVICCLEFGVTPDKLLSQSKKPSLCAARTAVAVMLQHYSFMSHGEIAELLLRERSTITYSINNAENKPMVVSITNKVNEKFVRMFNLRSKTLF